MQETVTPRLGYIEFQELDSFKHSDKPTQTDDGWFIEGYFTVVDAVTRDYNKNKPFHKRYRGNKDGSLGHIFPFVICSKSFATKHHKEFVESGHNPIVLDTFDIGHATNVIAAKIRQAGDGITLDELWHHLSQFSDTDYDS